MVSHKVVSYKDSSKTVLGNWNIVSKYELGWYLLSNEINGRSFITYDISQEPYSIWDKYINKVRYKYHSRHIRTLHLEIM